MKIDSFQMFRFTFGYEGTELTIPMVATTQEEAVKKLREFMLGWANELAAPTLSPVQFKGSESDPEFGKKPPEPIASPDPFALQLRIEELVRILIPLKKPKGAQTIERLVKEWTGFPMEPQNYPSIIAQLGRISNEGKD